MAIYFEPIGIIHTPYETKDDMPVQPQGAIGVKGTVTINEQFKEGLKDLDGFSHIYLIYHFHKSENYTLEVMPFLDDTSHGVFATRAPKRPNAIGISVVLLKAIKDNVLNIENVDMLNGTPLLDIKPYIPDFDTHKGQKTGWLNDKTEKLGILRSDNRFK